MFRLPSNIPFRRVHNLPSRFPAAVNTSAVRAGLVTGVQPAMATLPTMIPILAAATILAACSSAPVKMECRELRMRIDYGDLSNDQLRFALQELEDCERRLKAAEAKDSASLESAERRFTPEDSLSPGDLATAHDSLPPAAGPAPTDTSGARE